MDLYAAGGNKIPVLGAIEATLEVPFLPNDAIQVPVVVVPTTEYGRQVPVIVGTNAINKCRERCETETTVPGVWQNAFVSSQKGRIGIVKSTNNFPIKIEPNETVTLSGLIRKGREVEDVVTEPTEGASSKLGVCPRVVKLDAVGKYQRVPVRLYNISASPIVIAPKTDLCELHEVKVLRSVDPVGEAAHTAQYCQQTAQSEKDRELPEGIDLTSSNLREEQREQLKDFLTKWNHIFSKDITDLGKCDLVKHQIKLDDNEPFKEPHRRIPPALFNEVREHLAEMLQAGAIRPSQSSYSSNVVIVRKKDGSLRFCVDFRKLNSKTIKDAYAIPRVEDTLHLLAGAKYFTKLDLRSGYWQVELEESDKHKTAFQVGTLGFYEFHRMPFGLCNAPATFQRLMERCMGELNLDQCLIYLDDVIIFSTTFEEHLQRLEAVFTRLQDHNLKLKAKKCDFLKSEVTYLGHVVSEEGIKTDPEKTEAIKNWPVPKSVKDVRSFLGFAGYYRRFIKGFANIARPLNDLLVGISTNGKIKMKKPTEKKKKPAFIWTERQQHAFEEIRQKLSEPPILAYADYSLPFQLHTDASTTGLGAVLYQNQNGIDRVVSYASRSLKDSEKNYPAHKLEFLALKWAVTEKFHDYLYGTSFEVYTDNNPLTYVFTTAKLDATGHRWLAVLSNYNCTLKYRSGKKNSDADGLSRLYENDTTTTTTVFPDVLKTVCQSVVAEKDQSPLVETLVDVDDDLPHDQMSEETIDQETLAGTALTSQDWRKAQASDPNICFVIDNLLTGRQPTTRQAEQQEVDLKYLSDWNTYKLKDGILYKSATFNGEQHDRLVLPDSVKDIVFAAYHDDLGHQGRDRTTSLINTRFYFPRLNKFIAEKVRSCGRCIRRKTAPTKAAGLVNITSSSPMELVCIDYLSLETSKGGFENILVITDHFSRFALAIPTRNQKAHVTAKALFENFFLYYGFPAKLHSDKGANFESKVIRKLCKLAGIQKTRTTPYHPMGNGMVERFNRTLLNMLGTLSDRQKKDWKSHVQTLTHAYNAAVHESTGFSPFFLMFGRHPRLAIDAFLGLTSSEGRKSHQDYADRLQERLQNAYRRAGEEALRKGKKAKKYYDQNVKHSIIVPGDRVLVKKVGIQGKHKLADIWETNTYIVTSQPMPDIPVFEVKQENGNFKPRLLHRNMLLPFNGLPVTEESDSKSDRERPQRNAREPDSDESTRDSEAISDDGKESETDLQKPETPKYVIPARRGKQNRDNNISGETLNSRLSRTNRQHNEQNQTSDHRDQGQRRRGARQRRKPEWMQNQAWQFSTQPYVFTVPADKVVYI